MAVAFEKFQNDKHSSWYLRSFGKGYFKSLLVIYKLGNKTLIRKNLSLSKKDFNFV